MDTASLSYTLLVYFFKHLIEDNFCLSSLFNATHVVASYVCCRRSSTFTQVQGGPEITAWYKKSEATTCDCSLTSSECTLTNLHEFLVALYIQLYYVQVYCT